MTTTIRDTLNSRDYVTIGGRRSPDNTAEVRIEVHHISHGAWRPGVGVVDRAEFLAAVAAELDVIIIPRADLPPVDTSDGAHVTTWFGHRGCSATTLHLMGEEVAGRTREEALAWLALAEHFEKNPPVDETQVAALVDLMDVSDDTGAPKVYADIARRLVQAGVRAPEGDQ